MDANSFRLDGQAAFVTGGGGGIGRAIALCLADMGADVAVLDIVPERCDEVVAQIEARGRRGLGLPADAMSTDQIEAAVNRAAEQFGRLDILINNVGGVARRLFTDLAEKNWRRHIDLNLVSTLAATSAALRPSGSTSITVRPSLIEAAKSVR